MFVSLNLLSQVLTAVTVVQASQSFSEIGDHKGLENRFIRPRGSNATNVNATVAGSKAVVADSTTGSSISKFPPQLVNLDLSIASIVQECDNATENPVVQDCSCSTEELAAQAINDAITMVQAVKDVWNDNVHLAILEQYMGAAGASSCQATDASGWIDATLGNLAKIQEYRWLPYNTNWLNEHSTGLSVTELFVYCATGVPPPQELQYTAGCQQNGTFGWAETSQASFIGFCETNLTQQNFISRAAMLEQLKAGQVSLSDERLGENYGRAALNLLVQLFPLINSQETYATIGSFFGYQGVMELANTVGCYIGAEYNSLVNADSWALWISTLYFTIQTIPTPTSSSGLPVTSANCNGHDSACKNFVSSGSCKTAASRYDSDAIYSQYTSHWFNSEDQEGCTAIFQCSSGYPAGGVSGADIQKYFAEIYTPVADGGAGCGICGSVYVNNGTNVCEFTFNECGFSTCQTCNGKVCTHP